MSKRKQQNFEHGAIILLLSTALSKIIGAVFKIPLGNILGDLGYGYFTSAYELFTPIYGLAMAGLPIAVSRLVAENVAKKRFSDAHAVLKLTKKAFTVTGILAFVLMLALIYPFVLMTDKTGDSLYSLLAIAPSILFCCITSIYRGYYEGMRNMFPTAISDVIEAAGKLLFGYSLAYIIVIYFPGREDLAAAGAIMGVTIGTVLASAFLLLRHKIKGDGITSEELISSPAPESQRVLFKALVVIAVPVVLSSIATNISGLIDVAMVKWQLNNTMQTDAETIRNMYWQSIRDYNFSSIKAGGELLSDAEMPTFLFGVRGKAFSIYNLIPTISSVLGVSALPVLASVWATDPDNKKEIKKNVESIMRFTAMIALPAGIGMCVLSSSIMGLLYNSTASVEIGGPLLAVFGIAAAFAGISAPITSMLQAIGKQMIPVRNIAIGAGIKIVVNFILVGVPEINILGAPIGTLCSFVFIFVANLLALIKYSGVTPNFWRTLIKPLIAALLCGGAALLVSSVLGEGTINTALSIVAAGIVYLAALVVLRAFTEEDVLAFPMGKTLLKICKKLRIV